MNVIMKLIYANSLFASVHYEFYEYNILETPIFLELIHNTDDDSLILLMITDPAHPLIHEINFSTLTDKNLHFIMQRYGQNTESIIENVESMFRSLEFYEIIRE